MSMPPHSTLSLRLLGSLGDHAGGATAVAWSPTAPTLATADTRSVHLWNVEKGSKLNDLFGPVESVTSLDWSPDGAFLACSAGRDIWIWGKGVERLTPGTPWIVSLAWSPDGQFLAWAGNDNDTGSVHVIDTTMMSEITVLEGIDGPITAVAWSPDSTMIAATAHDAVVRIWTPTSPLPWVKLRGHDDTAWCLSWSPDGRRMATGGLDGKISVWDVAARAEIRELQGHTAWVYAVAWSPDGTLIASGSGDPQGRDRSIRLWDPVQGVEMARMENAHNDIIQAIAWSPKGTLLATASGDERVSVWEVLG
jgi:WD40 repeat protein